MEDKRSVVPLVFGLILLLLGILFLAVNVQSIEIGWYSIWKFSIPSLFLLAGLVRLIRHFSLRLPELQERPRRAKLLSGIFLTSLGALILLDLLDYVNGIAFFGRYWPVILILFGLGKIVDFYRLQGKLQFRFVEVVGVILIVLIGFASARVARAHFPLLTFDLPLILTERVLSIGDLTGQKHQWLEEKKILAEGLQGIEIDNLYGQVTLEAGGGSEVEVRLTKVVHHRSERRARDIAEQLHISSRREGNLLRLGTNRLELGKEYNFNTHFNVRLPQNLKTRVVNAYGDVRLSRIQAACDVENSFGRVNVDFISGDVQIKNRHRPVDVRDVQGSVKIENEHGLVQVENVTGNVEVATDYDSIGVERVQGNVSARNQFGQVRLEKIAGGDCTVAAPGSSVEVSKVEKDVEIQNSHKPVTVREVTGALRLDTSYSRVNLEQVQGRVSVRSSHADIHGREIKNSVTVRGLGTAVSLSSIEGPIQVATSLRRVTLNGFQSRVEIQNEYGEIALMADRSPAADVVANNRNGRISLSLPSNSSFKLYAQASGGKIISDFGPGGQPLREGGEVLEAVFGRGKPEVRLQTMYSEIHIRKR